MKTRQRILVFGSHLPTEFITLRFLLLRPRSFYFLSHIGHYLSDTDLHTCVLVLFFVTSLLLASVDRLDGWPSERRLGQLSGAFLRLARRHLSSFPFFFATHGWTSHSAFRRTSSHSTTLHFLFSSVPLHRLHTLFFLAPQGPVCFSSHTDTPPLLPLNSSVIGLATHLLAAAGHFRRILYAINHCIIYHLSFAFLICRTRLVLFGSVGCAGTLFLVVVSVEQSRDLDRTLLFCVLYIYTYGRAHHTLSVCLCPRRYSSDQIQ